MRTTLRKYREAAALIWQLLYTGDVDRWEADVQAYRKRWGIKYRK